MLVWRRSVLHRGIFEDEPSGLELDWRPDLDVFETPDAFVLCFSLAGVAHDEVDVRAAGRTLLVSGVRSHHAPPNAVARQLESSSGRFARSVRLPAEAAMDRIEVRMDNGMLEVRVPKDAG